MSTEIRTNVLVLGAGPSGYSSAFRCRDLGLETVLVERYPVLGGVCLNVGCIPSKALLHVAKIIKETRALNKRGVVFGKPTIDIKKVRFWKNQVITHLNTGLTSMANARQLKIINGVGKFTDAHTLQINKKNGPIKVTFDNAIIAAGSRPASLPYIPYKDHRIWNSTDALNLDTVPKRLLIIGGGIIGLEIATIYQALGSEIDIVEVFDQIIPSADKDVVKIFTKQIESCFNLMLSTKVTSILSKEDGLFVTMKGEQAPNTPQFYEAILVAVGRIPNADLINIDRAGVKLNERGFIIVNQQMRTNIKHIYAVGDIVGSPMLAHKGIYEGHIAAEVISGKNHYFNPKVIPSIAYTEPEIAWIGLTEKQAKEQKINYECATFPWIASGRAIASNCPNGMTKLLFHKESRHLIGGAVVGSNGGELLGEIGLAIEMGCDAQDIALSIHAHPTLYESIGLAAEAYEGTITDLVHSKIRKR